MPTGSCMCGQFRYEYSGDPQAKLACHCYPCRKTSGTPTSYNFLVPASNFKVTDGTPKQYVRKGDSGKDVTYNFCPNCGGLLFVKAEVLPDAYIVKLGTIDEEDVLNAGKPEGELFCKNRINWTTPVPGATQSETS